MGNTFFVFRSLMYSEANRRETFTSWPHVGYRWAQPDPMAQAGFYHQVKRSVSDIIQSLGEGIIMLFKAHSLHILSSARDQEKT